VHRLIALGLAACGRVNFDPLAAAPPVDAAPDAALQLIDTLVVPATGEVQTSTVLLVSNKTYTLVARGSCDISGLPNLLDADYNYDDAQMNDKGDDGVTDVGLGIDDDVVDNDKFPKWGPYRPDHVYSIKLVGKGTTITARVHDSAFGNNAGELTVEIYQ